MIVIAAVSIAVAAVDRLLHPRPIEKVGIGLAVSVVASLVNLSVELILRRAARVHRSATLNASSHHLLTDVWTSAGVLVGVGAVALTGWLVLDPVVALAVAANIVFTGGRIMRDSVAGLMDAALPPNELAALRELLDRYAADDADVLFAMIDGGRPGVTRACRELPIRQIGNVLDWVQRDPAVFIASAVADSGRGLARAIDDFAHGRVRCASTVEFGLAQPDYVRLVVAPELQARFGAELARWTQRVIAGSVQIDTEYSGPEL
jgi:hypothetical protein